MASRGSAKTRRRSSSTAVKIVVTGPFAAGKTTFIRTISDITVLSTERDVSDDTSERKAETTVAMDYGRITVDRELVLYLFGTPGQERFEFMWEILGEGMIGFILLVDGTHEASLTDAATILASFRTSAPGVPFVVALNRLEQVLPELDAQVRERLTLDARTAVVACSALERDSVREVVLSLFYEVLHAIDVDEGVEPQAANIPDDASTEPTSPRGA